MNKIVKLGLSICFVLTLLVGCSSSSDGKVVIYSNADEEVQNSIKKALDDNGYKDQYILQTFGTSELGGKIIAEGTNIEADLITMSSYYVDSAQKQNNMFVDLTFDKKTLNQNIPSYSTPLLSIEGTIILNTTLMQEKGLSKPTSIKDLAKPEYAGNISIVDMSGSSTGWLLVQSLISEYGEDEAKTILTGIMKNAGPHLESSGSGPIKKARAGEVAIAFGLRHQAVADKEKGLPIDYVDPSEGNFALVESIAVIKKEDEKVKKAMEMAECIVNKARTGILENYPITLYEGEKTDTNKVSAKTLNFNETLTVELLDKHLKLSNECKLLAQNN